MIMTENDFLRQVWRAFDSVTLDNGIKGRVINVCFPTRSVRINLPAGGVEWIKYDMIVEHKSSTGEPDDLAIIADLHGRLMKANQEIDFLKDFIKKQNEVISVDGLKNLRKSVTEVRDSLASKQKRIAQAVSAMDRIHKWLDEKGVPQVIEEK